jgi:DUF1365 family protein
MIEFAGYQFKMQEPTRNIDWLMECFRDLGVELNIEALFVGERIVALPDTVFDPVSKRLTHYGIDHVGDPHLG